MTEKEEKSKRQAEKAKRESKIVQAMSDIGNFKKGFDEEIFWTAINRIQEKKRIEKQANREIAEAQKKLEDAKRKYGR